jgi:lipid II:glycine glycyltransferase (peptidoglycan interpeptide bridge formation enzyme)
LSYDVHKEEKSIIKLKQGYYKKFITPYTAVINLEKSEEEILARMKPKGRYNIRLSEKK